VQTPQDYRNYRGSRFFQAAYDGYKYFFAVSMPSRKERNAIIFAGTMGLLRKRVLQELGAGMSGASPRTQRRVCAF